MSAHPPLPWAEANQHALMAALGHVRRHLEDWLAKRATPPQPADPIATAVPEADSLVSSAGESARVKVPADLELIESALDSPSALATVCAAFNLSPFERDLLLLCAGPDLDSKFAALLAEANGERRRSTPTFSIALAALPEAHWSALLPTAPLRRWRLIEPGGGDSLVNSPLRMDEWMLHFLAGTPYLDERLQSLVRPIVASSRLSSSQRDLIGRVTGLCQTHPLDRPWPLVQLCGDSPHDQLDMAAGACAALNFRLYRLAAADVPPSAAERDTFARLWERQAALCGSALLLDLADADTAEASRALALLESINSLVVVLTREPLRGLTRHTSKLDVPRPSVREQHDLWRESLGRQAAALNGQLEVVAGQFCLSAREIHEAALVLRGASVTSRSARHTEPAPTLWSLCRAQSRARLEALAQRLEPASTWEDLVLPEAQLRTLREMAAQVRQRFHVYEQWGFAAKGARGLGISALFAGPSGTGKTMAAEVLACELDLDLFRIDLSAVVSKYIGETEKNLRRVFDAAEAGGAVLLFDEADALFGKRSEVKDSHDRYANIEVGYLLQRIETYRGLAILTTNFKQALDAAFLRRLRFVVQFPFPDLAQRAEIWRRVFPAATPTDALDPVQLSRLNVTGGNIHNIALNAAFLAADSQEPVRMKHLLQAARSECAKLDRSPSEAELGGWK